MGTIDPVWGVPIRVCLEGFNSSTRKYSIKSKNQRTTNSTMNKK